MDFFVLNCNAYKTPLITGFLYFLLFNYYKFYAI